jgi:hypothetical protein
MSTTPTRDRLHTFYAARPDIENATGGEPLDLPENLLDELDELLLNTTQERTINEHVAGCRPCREFGFCVTFLPDGTVRCERGSENGWDGARSDSTWAA